MYPTMTTPRIHWKWLSKAVVALCTLFSAKSSAAFRPSLLHQSRVPTRDLVLPVPLRICRIISTSRRTLAPSETSLLVRQYMNRDDLQDNVATEETLLCAHLSRLPYADLEADEIQQLLLKYTQSFPFAAVLPVQPLLYLPLENGVDVQFLRKKTAEKPTVDGGIRILLEYSHDEEGKASWTITAKRNSEGQSIAKIFAEKLVVNEYLDGLTGKSIKYVTPGTVQPREVVEVTSVYHKWMSERR